MAARVRSLRAASAFVDRVGLALVFPKADVVLPSLYEAVAGSGPIRWMEELDDGSAALTPEVARLWRWKDDLAAERLACAGKHLRGWPALVSLALLPSLYSLTGRSGRGEDFRDADLSPLEREVAEVVSHEAPVDARGIRETLGTRDTRGVNRALDALQRMLVLTRAGTVDRDQGWPGTAYDVLARRYRKELRRLPGADDARLALASAVLGSAGEVSAADLSGALGLRRAEAAAALDRLVDEGAAGRREEGDIALWVPADRV